MQLNFSGDLYDYYMPAVNAVVRECADLVGPTDVWDEDLDKWKKVDLAEIKSIVCDNDVWDSRLVKSVEKVTLSCSNCAAGMLGENL